MLGVLHKHIITNTELAQRFSPLIKTVLSLLLRMLARLPSCLLDGGVDLQMMLEHRQRTFQPPPKHELGWAVAVRARGVAIGGEEGFRGEAGVAGLHE